MPRFLFAVALFFTAVLVPAQAQVYTIQPRPIRVENKPRGGFSLSFFSTPKVGVSFAGAGNIASSLDINNTTALAARVYDDGIVDLDQRSGGNAAGISDDGRTNRWTYLFNAQQTPDGNIAFHQYSTESNGTPVDVETGKLPGIDMQYDMCIGVFGPKIAEKTWTFSWGGMVGGSFSAINAKTNKRITANLRTITDFYSLEGAAVPPAGYSAPSTKNVPGFDANGNPISFSVDDTTLINNRPYARTNQLAPDGAQVDGFWQVKGGYYTFRVGPWLRWQLGQRLSLRASVGATYSFLGVTTEYDELLVEDKANNLELRQFVRSGASSQAERTARFGTYGALDAEWWLSDRTGFFAGVTYENSGRDVHLHVGDSGLPSERTATVHLPNGAGFRAGISVLF